MDVSEGHVTLTVPEQPEEGVGDAVFFNPDQELNRDLTIATLRAARERIDGLETYFDATAASGVRGVRAAADGWTVECCDTDPDAVTLARENLARNDLAGTVHEGDATVRLHEQRYDIVDLDPFGTPMPFVDAAVRATDGVLAVTATDLAPLCGAHFRSGVRSYATVPRNTEYHGEMAVRVLIGALVRAGARYDRALDPLFTHASDHYVRTYLAVGSGAQAADAQIDRLGYVHHCTDCLHRDAERDLIAHPPADCPACGGSIVTAGPIWLGAIRDREFTAATREHVDASMGTADRARDLLDRIEHELDTPTHYDQHRLCKEWGRSASGMDEFLDALRAAGYQASRTQYGGTTFKTDADVDSIRAATDD
ncbi:tRNA (guanine(26)-N(2))-dimethyltransferase [Halococcoides cellulosivorans]|uniref:tRNA (guanine(26)-N(2))-dimethyltransferase n=1 Tax=Halococcoides cellulosivorans TaxID=1679096 RepID=A0A2R4X1D9_9EURY|nr:tRNA (guanine(26)-N(2))-dimethyltransferase [Halococcoides cellulosivorans]AWB27612.1 tRNA (guanine(26)-N(2))-dimethyltransferase [Halococcoides cellulosivorans]